MIMKTPENFIHKFGSTNYLYEINYNKNTKMLTRVIYGLAEREKISYFYDSESSLSMHCLKTRKECKAKEKKLKSYSTDQFTPPELLKGDKEKAGRSIFYSRVYFTI